MGSGWFAPWELAGIQDKGKPCRVLTAAQRAAKKRKKKARLARQREGLAPKENR